MVGQVIIPISINGFQSNQPFTVIHDLTVDCILGTVDCILGTDCLLKHGVVIDCKQHCITMSGVELPFLPIGCGLNHTISCIWESTVSLSDVGRQCTGCLICVPAVLMGCLTIPIVLPNSPPQWSSRQIRIPPQ